MLHLQSTTTDEWLQCALGDFDALLVDHAHCEHKASVTALSFVSKYPDDEQLVLLLSALARDEADHFHQVASLCFRRGLQLGHPAKDRYVEGLLSQVRNTMVEGRIDRLLCCAIIEARSCERLKLLAQHLPAHHHGDDVNALYDRLWREEATHHMTFVELAQRSWRGAAALAHEGIRVRLQELCAHEAHLLSSLPVRAAIH
jgi:tRNA 2-(methylsulfanyl)-N6-isopentenyladenosine37 hydroxylase